MNVKFLLPAWIELRDAFAYYENQRAGLGHQFRDEVLAAVERIRQHPQAWAPLSSNIRRCRTNRFPYGIIYEAIGSEIIVVAVSHLHRRPDHWRGRK